MHLGLCFVKNQLVLVGIFRVPATWFGKSAVCPGKDLCLTIQVPDNVIIGAAEWNTRRS